MKKLLVVPLVIIFLQSCGGSEENFVKVLKRENPGATVMKSNGNSYYVVDSVKIMRYDYSRWVLNEEGISNLTTLTVVE